MFGTAVGIDEDTICTARRVAHLGLFKSVSFVPLHDGQISRQTVTFFHGMARRTWQFRVRAGEPIRLWYPFWSCVRVGDEMTLSRIADHPFAQLRIIRWR